VPKVRIIAGCTLLVVGAALASYARPVATRTIQNRAFATGEKLRFSLEYGPIKAGSAIMEIKDQLVTVDGRPCYHVVSKANSSRFFSLFFLVNDQMESFIDTQGIFSRKFTRTIKEGQYEDARTVHYDYEKGLAVTEKDTFEIPSFVQDAVSVIYYVRTQPLWTGKKIALDHHSGRKFYPIETRVLGEERVTVAAGTFDCYIVEPFPREGAFRSKGSLVVWLTKDERKMPVLMKSKLFFGSIAARLVSYEIAD